MKLTTNISPVTVTALSTLCNGFNNKLYYFWLLQRIKYMLVNEGTNPNKHTIQGVPKGVKNFLRLNSLIKKTFYLLGENFCLVWDRINGHFKKACISWSLWEDVSLPDVQLGLLNCFISSDGVCCSKVVKTELSESKETKKGSTGARQMMRLLQMDFFNLAENSENKVKF